MEHCPYNTDCSGCVSFGATLLDISHVNLSFGSNLVLRDVNTTIQKVSRKCHIQGQVVGILGPSGMGKTQLFRIISGLMKPTSGGVYINTVHTLVKPGEVGVVSQSYTLFEHRTVFGNLMLAAKKKYKTENECNERINFYLNMFELTSKKHSYPAQLSGGQRQRIAIVQQLLSSNHFLLMDEPYSGLDIIMLEKVNKLIVDISCLDDLNTVIVISHDIASLASVADHLWLLGRERDETGNIIPGARIVENYNLVDLGLCWQENIRTRPDFVNFLGQVEQRFHTL